MADTRNLRPAVFIGSSKEGLPVAEAIQLNLDYCCEATIWSQGLFGLSGGSLESLVGCIDTFDFAVLVLTPDDVSTSRGDTRQSPRDNVLFELGLCMGALGRDRSFIVHDRTSNLKVPSDLAGVTAATFHVHSDGNLQASLGAATTLIKGSIERLGRRQPKISAEIDANTQFQIIHDLLDHAPEQFIIWMYENNKPIVRQERFFDPGIPFVYNMRNTAAGNGTFSMDDLCRKLADADLLTVDLRNNVSLTPRGKQFAKWLIENGHKATHFQSRIGGWGEVPEGGFGWPPRVPDPAAGDAPPKKKA